MKTKRNVLSRKCSDIQKASCKTQNFVETAKTRQFFFILIYILNRQRDKLTNMATLTDIQVSEF